MVQCVRRDTNDDFRPLPCSDDDDPSHVMALNDMVDVALLTLTDLYSAAEAYLKCHGWYAVDETESGGIVYEHNETGELSEEPAVNGEEMSWSLKLLLSIPVLIRPGCVDGEVVWAASVLWYHHGGGEDDGEDEQQFDLECNANDAASCISVIDVLKSDEDGQCTRLRGVYNGIWRGLYTDAMGEMDVNLRIGRHLELWTETTMAGLCGNDDAKESIRVLVIGLAGGQLVSFLNTYYSNMQQLLTVVEPSQQMVDIAIKYYQFPPNLLHCVSIMDPIEYVKSQCLQDGEYGDYDTIIVNMNSSDGPFPVNLLSGDFFNGLLGMLSNHPTATLLINSGSSTDAVYNHVQQSCKNLHCHGHRLSGHPLLLREYLLRGGDNPSTDNNTNSNEGSIVAARRRQWTLSVQDWQRQHNLGKGAQISGAMDVARAQQTQVVRLERFLSRSDIELIHTVAQTDGPFPVNLLSGDFFNGLL
jgi:hypothetical protein